MELPKKLQMQILDLFMNCLLDGAKAFFQASLHQLQSKTSSTYSLLLLVLLKWRLSSLHIPLSMTLLKVKNIMLSVNNKSFNTEKLCPNNGLNKAHLCYTVKACIAKLHSWKIYTFDGGGVAPVEAAASDLNT